MALAKKPKKLVICCSNKVISTTPASTKRHNQEETAVAAAAEQMHIATRAVMDLMAETCQGQHKTLKKHCRNEQLCISVF